MSGARILRTAAEVHGLLAEERGPAVAPRVASPGRRRRGRRAQVPQNALPQPVAVTAAVSRQRMLRRPVRARDARRENATGLALLGEALLGPPDAALRRRAVREACLFSF